MPRSRTGLVAGLIAAFGSGGSALAVTPAIRCAGPSKTPCPPGLVCVPIPDRRDEPGICHVPAPTVCTTVYRPVCGKDFRTYPNECEMRRNFIGLQHLGRC